MVDEDQLLSYAELINEIRSCCYDRVSGTLLIITEENLLIRIILDEGIISGMICGTTHGMDVIAKIRQVGDCRLKVSSNVMGKNDDLPLLETKDILERLLPTETAPVGGITIDNIVDSLVPAVLNILEEELVEFLGPMASIIWEEQLSKMAQPVRAEDLKALINELNKVIDDTDSVLAYKERIDLALSNL